VHTLRDKTKALPTQDLHPETIHINLQDVKRASLQSNYFVYVTTIKLWFSVSTIKNITLGLRLLPGMGKALCSTLITTKKKKKKL
jgi:hypothetical protein